LIKDTQKTATTSLPERIELVGTTLYPGPGGWTKRLAVSLGISRSQLFEYRRGGSVKVDRERNLDGELLELIDREIDRERAASFDRDALLVGLKRRLQKLVKRAGKE
jgi:hypothetical protein